jgi:hypothetical protein
MNLTDIRRALKLWRLKKAAFFPINYASTGSKGDTAFHVDGRFIAKASNQSGALLRSAVLQKALMEENCLRPVWYDHPVPEKKKNGQKGETTWRRKSKKSFSKAWIRSKKTCARPSRFRN